MAFSITDGMNALSWVEELSQHGRIVCVSDSSSFVECQKHPGVWIPVALSMGVHPIVSYRQAFDSCLECLEDLRQKSSRWPEGAEL